MRGVTFMRKPIEYYENGCYQLKSKYVVSDRRYLKNQAVKST